MPTAVTIAGFGTGVSPIIADGMVILMRDVAKDPKIIALDIATGKPKWEKKRESNSSFRTPAIWNTPSRASKSSRLASEDDRLRPRERRRRSGTSMACRPPVARRR